MLLMKSPCGKRPTEDLRTTVSAIDIPDIRLRKASKMYCIAYRSLNCRDTLRKAKEENVLI